MQQPMDLNRAFTLIEPGPVTLITTNDGQRSNIMTITWTMARGFSGEIAICTGPWNHSWAALKAQGECVIAIPGADMIDTVIGIGTCSGTDTDKFARFDLTALPAHKVGSPLIGECLGNIECRVVELIPRYDLVILQGVAAWANPTPHDGRMLHAVGDGTFRADGEAFDRRHAMRSKLPDSVL